MKDSIVEVSLLEHTWIIDLDGTILKHNGYKIDGYDTLLEGAKEFLDSISENDLIIFITARKECFRTMTVKFLEENNVRYNHIIFEAPYGERILINDNKPSGLKMGIAYNKTRDSKQFPLIKKNKDL